jgi:recombination protein RecA
MKVLEQLNNLMEPEQDLKPKKSLEPLTKAEKQKALKSVQKSLDKEFDTVMLQFMGKRVGQRLPSFPTGLVSVDEELIGCGGVPKGRIVEVYGPEASGKTTFCLHVVSEVQKAGGMAVYIDAEHSLDPSYASKIGVNMDELMISQPDNGEQALSVAEALVEARACDIIIIDSVAALVPQAELDGEMGDSHMGLQARLMSQALRKLTGICNTNGVTIIFINQIREKIGVMFGNPETTTGGRALKFYASLRIEIRQMSKGDGGIIEVDGKRVGQRSRLKAVKNKVGGAPYASTEICLMYESGWDKREDMVDYAVKLGVIEPGAWHVFEGQKFRKNDLRNEPVYSTIIDKVSKALEKKKNESLGSV